MRFYLDENLSPKIAEIARALGLDVVSALESGYRGFVDEDHLLPAALDGRCLVTADRDDFIRLTLLCFETRRPHAGVLIVPASMPTSDFARIAHALDSYERSHAGGSMSYLIDFLN